MIKVVTALILGMLELATVGGCRESNAERKTISLHTKELAKIVADDPNSGKGQTALVELIGILNSKWRFARCQACYAMGEIGQLASPALPDLMRAADCGDGFVQEAAVYTLSKIGPSAAPAIDLLEKKLRLAMATSSNGLETWHAADALGNIGYSAVKAIPVLEEALQSNDATLVEHVAKSLQTLKQLKRPD
jgi:HEAT repeat protein